MADNIKDWAINWLLIGLFSLSLISFVVFFPIYQGEGDIFQNDTRLSDTITLLEGNISTSQALTNTNLNLTEDYDPTTSFSGSDYTQIGQSLNLITFAKATKDVLSVYLYYMLGEASVIVLIILASIFSLTATYYAIKNLRTGT